MDNWNPDQATTVRRLRRLLAEIQWLETEGAQDQLERADALRHEAEDVGRPLPDDLVNRFLFEYSGPAILMP